MCSPTAESRRGPALVRAGGGRPRLEIRRRKEAWPYRPLVPWRALDGGGKRGKRRGPADDRALGAYHFHRGALEFRKITFGCILNQQAFVAAIVRFAHGGLHADFSRDPGEQQVGDALQAQDIAEGGCAKCT